MLMERLRGETRPWHERVEQAVDIVASCRRPDTYRALLGRLLGLYEPLERTLAGFDWAAHGLDFDARRKVPHLVADLAAIGTEPDAIARLPRAAAELPRPATPAQAFGVLYVVEGATLGGALIARAVEASLGLTAAHGASFHAGYGERNGAMWRQFRTAADAACGDDAARQRDAVGAACATFEAFERWLAPAAAARPPQGEPLRFAPACDPASMPPSMPSSMP